MESGFSVCVKCSTFTENVTFNLFYCGRFSATVEGPGRDITSGTPLRIAVYLKQSHIGRYDDRLELLLEDTQLKKSFFISRSLKATIGNRDVHEALRPKAPYVPRQRKSRPEPKEVVEGVKPPAVTAVKYAVVLPTAAIPGHLFSALSNSDSAKKINHDVRRIFMPKQLNSDTYARHFKHLLWIEEFKMGWVVFPIQIILQFRLTNSLPRQDLERYDIRHATLARHNKYY